MSPRVSYPPIVETNLLRDYARRLQTPATYVIYAEGSMVRAEHCDGTTDYSGSYSASGFVDVTQSAIDNLTANRLHEEKILIKGNFTWNDSILLDSYTMVEIQGKITLANPSDPLDAPPLFMNRDRVNGNEYIDIIGNGAIISPTNSFEYLTYYGVIDFLRVWDYRIEQLTFVSGLDTYSSPIYVELGGRGIISKNIILDFDGGIEGTTQVADVVAHNICYNETPNQTWRAGVDYCASSSGLTLRANWVYGFRIGINMGVVYRLSSIGNILEFNWRHGISANCQYSEIANNICWNNDVGSSGTYDGIELGDPGTYVARYTIVNGNVCYDNRGSGSYQQEYGIDEANGNFNIICNNSVWRNRNVGADINRTGANTKVCNNIGRYVANACD